MSSFNFRQSGATALMALAIASGTAAPIIQTTPVLAQYYSQSGVSLPAGTRIPVTYNKQKVVVSPNESVSVTLTTATDVTDPNGNVSIPAGTKIEGRIEPAGGGSRFVARRIVFDSGRRVDLDAVSGVVTRTERVKKGAGAGSILTGAAAGGGAAAILSAVTGGGNIPIGAVLGGAGAGAAGGALLGGHKADVIVIYPSRDLTLRLRSSLSANYRY